MHQKTWCIFRGVASGSVLSRRVYFLLFTYRRPHTCVQRQVKSISVCEAAANHSAWNLKCAWAVTRNCISCFFVIIFRLVPQLGARAHSANFRCATVRLVHVRVLSISHPPPEEKSSGRKCTRVKPQFMKAITVLIFLFSKWRLLSSFGLVVLSF